MLKNKENIIILILALIVAFLYIKKYYNKEDFEVMFSPYYPISSQVVVKNNNVENNIEDFRLDKIKNVLKNVIHNANEGNTEYMQFNYANRPVIKNLMTPDKLKPVTDFLIDAINSNLPNGHKVKLLSLKDMYKNEVDDEVKVNFKIVCEYKIKTAINYKYERQIFKSGKNQNNLILDVEVISKRNIETEKLHLNILNLVGIDGEYLPGSNYYKNDNHYSFTNSLSNKIINNKKKLNKEENDDMNETILPDNSIEESTFTDINTEEAESFFDI
jgi:hypothetical protein